MMYHDVLCPFKGDSSPFLQSLKSVTSGGMICLFKGDSSPFLQSLKAAGDLVVTSSKITGSLMSSSYQLPFKISRCKVYPNWWIYLRVARDEESANLNLTNYSKHSRNASSVIKK